MTSNTNHLSNRLPSIPAAVQLAANEGAFALVPEFCLTAPALRVAVDLIADDAMIGLETVTQAIAAAPAELQPLLNELRALFGSIGHKADATASNIGADLSEVWGVAAALSCS